MIEGSESTSTWNRIKVGVSKFFNSLVQSNFWLKVQAFLFWMIIFIIIGIGIGIQLSDWYYTKRMNENVIIGGMVHKDPKTGENQRYSITIKPY